MLRPNLRGLFDLHGNLAEWTHDWYDVFTAKKLTDPTGPEKGTDRVQRGGSWGIAPSFCRTSLRYSGAPTFRSDFLGFRPAVTIIK
jgi:formylglycine-generating enzyme required for sulfatase activity